MHRAQMRYQQRGVAAARCCCPLLLRPPSLRLASDSLAWRGPITSHQRKGRHRSSGHARKWRRGVEMRGEGMEGHNTTQIAEQPATHCSNCCCRVVCRLGRALVALSSHCLSKAEIGGSMGYQWNSVRTSSSILPLPFRSFSCGSMARHHRQT